MKVATTYIAALAGTLVWSLLLTMAAAHLRGDAPTAGTATDTMSFEAPGNNDIPVNSEGAAAEGPRTGAETGIAAGTEGKAATAAGAADEKRESKPVRSVQSDAFEFPVAKDASGLERIEARPPLQRGALEKAPEPVVLQRPATVAAGLMAFGKQNLRLAGVVPTEHTRRCTGPDGREWPCGEAARTAQRLFIRNRAVKCDLPSRTWEGTVTAECRLGDKSIAAWLVENGWAEAEAGLSLAPLGEAAKTGARGIYGNDPREKAKAAGKAAP